MKTMIALATGVLLVAATPSLSFAAAQKKGPAATTGQSTKQGPMSRSRFDCNNYMRHEKNFRGKALGEATKRCMDGANE